MPSRGATVEGDGYGEGDLDESTRGPADAYAEWRGRIRGPRMGKDTVEWVGGESRRTPASARSTMRAIYSSCHALARARVHPTLLPLLPRRPSFFFQRRLFRGLGPPHPAPPPAGLRAHMWGWPFPQFPKGSSRDARDAPESFERVRLVERVELSPGINIR